ncbi:hypothetical protein K470DRAFT_258314 [Piedraia hortae CBS 480.64]|uniref:Uncharacterized protein n=1 Tax=Piedraia hortae CBS 480.64 TaxID=1314780 RepID=A0A6A7BXK7_9PEZI|nr:hypothetical protein K470DRAFT_258314 [Piedraia hortae CBS 480.64]
MSQVSDSRYTMAEVANAARRFDPKMLPQGYGVYHASDLSIEGVYATSEGALIALENSEMLGYYVLSEAAYSGERGPNRTNNPEGATIYYDYKCHMSRQPFWHWMLDNYTEMSLQAPCEDCEQQASGRMVAVVCV